MLVAFSLRLKQGSTEPYLSLTLAAKIIGFMWRDESVEVRKFYDEQAALKKAEHLLKYPGQDPD